MLDYIADLNNTFSQSDKIQAHFDAKKILLAIAKEREFMFSFLLKFLSNPNNLDKKRHHPIINIPIEQNEYYTLVAHLWFTLPPGIPCVSHQSIHHHGSTLLTSVAPFGEGYESVLFKKNWTINSETREVHLEVDKFYKNYQYSIDFVDAYAPHIVFYPEKFSITYALWSKDKNYLSNKLKQKSYIQLIKKPLKWLIYKTGLSAKLGVVGTSNLDFEIKDNKCYLMHDRVYGYNSQGDNINFIQNLLYAIQQVGFAHEQTLVEMKNHFRQLKKDQLVDLVDQLLNEKPINDVFYEKHLLVDERVNIPKTKILKLFNLDPIDN